MPASVRTSLALALPVLVVGLFGSGCAKKKNPTEEKPTSADPPAQIKYLPPEPSSPAPAPALPPRLDLDDALRYIPGDTRTVVVFHVPALQREETSESVRNLAALSVFKEAAPDTHLVGDFSLNVANELTADLLLGHGLARLVPSYAYSEQELFSCDGAPTEIAEERRRALTRLGAQFEQRSPKTLAMSVSGRRITVTTVSSCRRYCWLCEMKDSFVDSSPSMTSL